MKCVNLASLDETHVRRGITGLTGVSRTDREVWEEFHRNPEPLCFEAATSLAAYSELPITVPDEFDITE